MELTCACSMIALVPPNGVSSSNHHLFKSDGNGNHPLVMDRSLLNSLLTSKLQAILRISSRFIESQTGSSHSTFLSSKLKCTIVCCSHRRVRSALVSDGLKVTFTYNQLPNSPTRTVRRLCLRISAIGPTGQVIVPNGSTLALMRLILKLSQLLTGNGLNPCLTRTFLEVPL